MLNTPSVVLSHRASGGKRSRKEFFSIPDSPVCSFILTLDTFIKPFV